MYCFTINGSIPIDYIVAQACLINICNSRSKALIFSSKQFESSRVKFSRGQSSSLKTRHSQIHEIQISNLSQVQFSFGELNRAESSPTKMRLNFKMQTSNHKLKKQQSFLTPKSQNSLKTRLLGFLQTSETLL